VALMPPVWEATEVILDRLLLPGVPTDCHTSTTGIEGEVLAGVFVGVTVGCVCIDVETCFSAVVGWCGDDDRLVLLSTISVTWVSTSASFWARIDVAFMDSDVASPLTLGGKERSGREEVFEAVSTTSFFFFFLFRGGRFFFSDSRSSSHLLDATSESETPSSSAVDFQ
jgi:hypothetical protein